MTSIDVANFFLAKAQESGVEMDAALLQHLLSKAKGLFSEEFVPYGSYLTELSCPQGSHEELEEIWAHHRDNGLSL